MLALRQGRDQQLRLQLLQPVLDLQLDIKEIQGRLCILGLRYLDLLHFASDQFDFNLNEHILDSSLFHVLPVAIDCLESSLLLLGLSGGQLMRTGYETCLLHAARRLAVLWQS